MNDDIIRMAREAGWSGLYVTYNEPTGKADWDMVKESLTVPVTMEQIERFVALVRADERKRSAEVAYEFLDDPFLSGHGYATGCRDAILAGSQK